MLTTPLYQQFRFLELPIPKLFKSLPLPLNFYLSYEDRQEYGHWFCVVRNIIYRVFLFYKSITTAYLKEEQRKKDSIAKIEALNAPKIDPQVALRDSILRDSIGQITAAGNFQTAGIGKEQTVIVENELMKVTFSNKGGQVKSVELKKYKSSDSNNVVMGGSAFDNISYSINTAPNQSASTATLFFTPNAITKTADGNQSVSFTLAAPNNQSITHQYVIRPNDYLIDWNVVINGANQILTNNALNLNWQVRADKHQSDVKYERQQARLCYFEDDDYDFSTAANGVNETFEKPVKWFTVKQQFFNSYINCKK